MQCREILEMGRPDIIITDKQVEQIRDFLSLLAEIEIELIIEESQNSIPVK